MLVTIFSDASYCMQTQAAGWAGWAKSQRGQIDHSGPIRHFVGGAAEAEMCAIINAIAIAKKAEVAIAGDTLLIESDSLDAMLAFRAKTGTSKTGKKSKKARKRYARRQTLVDAFWQHAVGFEVQFKHVKGHQQNTTARAYINNQCDFHSRRHMRAEQARRRQPKSEGASA